VMNSTSFLSAYPAGAILHGSSMWGCKNAKGEDWQILAKVTRLHAVDEHHVQVESTVAAYPDLFTSADILLQQPSLVVAAETSDSGESAPDSSSHRLLSHAPMNEVKLETDMQTFARSQPESDDAPSTRGRHAMQPMDGELNFYSPSGGSNFRVSDRVTVSFSGYSAVTSRDGDKTLSLFRRPLIDTVFNGPTQLGSMYLPSCESLWNNVCTFSVPLSYLGGEQDVRPFYFEIKICETWFLGLTQCDTSRSDDFYIPLSTSGEWAPKHAVAFHRDCAAFKDQCASGSSSLSKPSSWWVTPICSLCDEGRSMSFDVRCDDCHLGYSASISKFRLQYAAISWNPYLSVEVRADAAVDANINLAASLTFHQQFEGSLTMLDQIPIPPSWQVKLGVITFAFGAFFSLDSRYNLDLKASAHVRASAAMNDVFSATAFFDSRKSPNAGLTASLPPLNFVKKPTLELDVNGEATLELVLTPIFNLELKHVIMATIQTDATVQFLGNFSFPAFPALPPPLEYDVDPSDKSLFHLGDCSTPHLLTYGISAGLQQSFASARLELDIGSSISSILQPFDAVGELGRWDFPNFMVPLLSGCLLPQRSSAPIVHVFDLPDWMQKDLSFSVEADLPSLPYNIAEDLALALNVTQSRFVVELLDKAGQIIDVAKTAQKYLESKQQQQQQQQQSNKLRTMDATTAVPLSTSTSTFVPPHPYTARVYYLDGSESDCSSESSASLAAEATRQINNPDSSLRTQGLITSDPGFGFIFVDPNPSSGENSGLSTGVLVGIVCGVLFGVAFLAVVGFGVWNKFYRVKADAVAPAPDSAQVAAATLFSPDLAATNGPTVSIVVPPPSTQATSATGAARAHRCLPSDANASSEASPPTLASPSPSGNNVNGNDGRVRLPPLPLPVMTGSRSAQFKFASSNADSQVAQPICMATSTTNNLAAPSPLMTEAQLVIPPRPGTVAGPARRLRMHAYMAAPDPARAPTPPMPEGTVAAAVTAAPPLPDETKSDATVTVAAPSTMPQPPPVPSTDEREPGSSAADNTSASTPVPTAPPVDLSSLPRPPPGRTLANASSSPHAPAHIRQESAAAAAAAQAQPGKIDMSKFSHVGNAVSAPTPRSS